ncbi:hypothetical protein ACFE04_013435 [Oxalis oulophora]
MTSSATSNIYIHVIEDVIQKVREEFVNNLGPGETTLTELQAMWEMKMMQAGAISGPIDRNSNQRLTPGGPTPVHDLNVPYEGTEEYETPTAEMLFPPTPGQTPMPTPLPGTAATTPLPGNATTPLPGSTDNSSMFNIPTGSSDYPTPVSDSGVNADSKGGRGSSYMQSPSPFWTTPRVPLDVNVAYVEGREDAERGTSSNQPRTQDFFTTPAGKRKRDELPPQYQNGGYIPQQDGAGDMKSAALQIPQLDGPIPDPYDDELSTPNIYNYQGVVNEDYNIASTPAPELAAGTPAPPTQNDAIEDGSDDESLNEDDDDDLDHVGEGEELSTQHLVLAQFEKVTRAKNRWKCTLKNGIMHINDKDILFNKATGEFIF